MQADTTARHLRNHLRAWLDQVQHGGTRVIVTRNGRPVGALVPMRDLRALQQAEGTSEAMMQARHAQEQEGYRRMRDALG